MIVVKKGSTVFPGNQPLFVDRGDGNPRLAVTEGQFVAYDPKRNISLDETTVGDVDTAVFAVGWKTDPKTGYALELRKAFSEETRKCDLVNGTAEPYKCGTAAVTDLLFRCIKPDATYTFNIEVEDWESESFRPLHHKTKKVYTVNTHECKCEPECDPQYECGDLVDDFIKQINGISETSPMDGALGRFHPERYQPFFAFKIQPRSLQFCLDAADDKCDVCTHLPAITGIKIGENSVSFTDTVDPNNTELTMKGQLNLIKIAIENAIKDADGEGTVTFTGSVGECCPTQLEIMTNLEDDIVLLGYEDAEIVNCGEETDILEDYGCGVRVVAKQLDFGCLCDLPASTYIKNKYRKIDINAVGDGWACNSVKVKKVQQSTVPRNWGYDLMEEDYRSQVGGAGRAHLPYNDPRGRFNYPSEDSRARNTGLINCREGYCTLHLENFDKFSGPFDTRGNTTPGLTTIAINMKDVDTIKDIQKIVNAFIADTSCPIYKKLECIGEDNQPIYPEDVISGQGGFDTTHGLEETDNEEE